MAYRASKAALNMMAACYAEEQAKDGVKVVAVHPGGPAITFVFAASLILYLYCFATNAL